MTRMNSFLALAFALLTPAGVAGAAGAAGAAVQEPPTGREAAETRVYDLPGDDVYPNGLAFDPVANALFVGNTEDGTILRGDLESGRFAVFSLGGADDRGPVFGLEVDGAGRLYAAARPNQIFVYDTADGTLLGRFTARGDGDRRLQEIAVAEDGAVYVTDATAPVLYRIPADTLIGAGTPVPTSGMVPDAELEAFIDLDGTPFSYRAGSGLDGVNADGIVVSADGAYLLIVQPNTGKLFRVTIATREVAEVDLGGATLDRGNGMDLDDALLYVLRVEEGVIAPVALTADFAAGVVGEEIADSSFDRPTAIALVGDGTALVANHQESPPVPPELPFVVSRVALPPAPEVPAAP